MKNENKKENEMKMKMKKKKDKTFEELWQLEQKIFEKGCGSTKKDLKEIYDCRELLIINDSGYAIASPLEEVPKNEVPDDNHGKENTLYVWSIGIIPEERGKGYGESLLYSLISFSTKFRISLDTTSPAMKRMCIKMGFKQISETYFLFLKENVI